MSVVTNVILKVFIDDVVPVDQVNEYLLSKNKGSLSEISAFSGGHKALECEIWVGAFNHLDIEEFIDVFKNCDTDWSEDLQLFIQDQNENKFRVIER